MPKDKVREKALPVGLFILLGTALLVFGLIWVRNMKAQPAYTFTVAFDNPDRVASGILAYYRGVKVGRVTDVQLDQDFDSTLVTIGIEEPRLRLAENVQIHVRLEGITGQRYIEIKQPDGRITAYIQPGEIVRGQDNVTWEQLQAQLARIAEDRTIEKLLTSAQETMEDMEIAAASLRGFFHESKGPAQNAVIQFNDTAEAIEMAALDFRGVVSPIRQAMPTLTASIEDFSRNTQGMDEAIVAVRDAANNIGSTADSFNRQLTDTNLIPETAFTVRSIRTGVEDTLGNLSGTSSEIRQGVSGVRESLTGQTPEVQRMRTLAGTLQQTGGTLEQRLLALSPQVLKAPEVREDVRRLSLLTQAIETETRLLEQEMDTTSSEQNVADVQRRLATLKALGAQTTDVADRLRTELRRELAEEVREYERHAGRGDKIPQKAVAANRMLATLNQLGEMGSHLTAAITKVEPAVASVQPGQRSSGGLFGGINAAIRQLRQTAARFDCLASQASEALGARFAGFRLFFGKPTAIDCSTRADLEEYSLEQARTGKNPQKTR